MNDRAKQGNGSLREAILFHLNGLYRFALRLTQNAHRAEELTHECVVRALKQDKAEVRDTRAWLFQILYHTFVSAYRHSLLEKKADAADEFGDTPRGAARPEPETLEDIRAAIEALPEDLRTVVWLSDAEEFGLREIADLLGWPLGTVASRLARARKELRRLLAAYGPPKEKQV